MNKTQIGLSLVLADFLALTLYAVYRHGYIGFFEKVVSNTVGLTVFADLLIALSLILVWMWRDARERSVSVMPYVLLTLGLGSVGPLLYLIRVTGDAPARALATDPARA